MTHESDTRQPLAMACTPDYTTRPCVERKRRQTGANWPAKILAYLQDAGRPVPAIELKEHFYDSIGSIPAALSKLFASGAVERIRQGKSFVYWIKGASPPQEQTPTPHPPLSTPGHLLSEISVPNEQPAPIHPPIIIPASTTLPDAIPDLLQILRDKEGAIVATIKDRIRALEEIERTILHPNTPTTPTPQPPPQILPVQPAIIQPSEQWDTLARSLTLPVRPVPSPPSERWAVYDLEIVRSWEEVGCVNGSSATPEQYQQMGISCAAVGAGKISDPFDWSYLFFPLVYSASLRINQNGTVAGFTQRLNDIQYVGNVLSSADCVLSFNGIGFDNKLLSANGYAATWKKDLDLNAVVIEARRKLRRDAGRTEDIARHGRLNDLSIYTLGLQKSGDGLGALSLLRQGRWPELQRYNIQDVTLNVLLAGFAYRYGFLIDDYGLIPLQIPGGAEPWEYPGRWFKEQGKTPDPKRPASDEQIRKLTVGKEGVHGPMAGPSWKASRCLTMVQASALIDALGDWNRLREQTERRAA